MLPRRLITAFSLRSPNMCLAAILIMGTAVLCVGIGSAWAATFQRAWLNNQPVMLEVANTPEAISKGLMGRTYLPARKGMLFVFNDVAYRHFWMKNTLVPLDMIFIKLKTNTPDDGHWHAPSKHKVGETGAVVQVIHNAMPCKKEPCAVYSSRYPADRVVELAGGQARTLGIKQGSMVRLDSH